MYITNKHRRIILCFVVYLLSVLMLFIASKKAHAGWECYQQMVITQEVSEYQSSVQSSSGSSMYTSDGYLRTSNHNTKSNWRSGDSGTSYAISNSNSTYRSTAVPHYFTICEQNGKIVSIIEHN